jgi:hypothetical protein
MWRDRVINKLPLKEDQTMSKRSHAAENVQRFVIATAGALALLGAIAWGFTAFYNGGCSGGIECRTAEQRAQVHY